MKNKNLKNKPILTCKKVIFLSPHDEEAFFEWIKKIPCVGRYYGSKREIYLETVSGTIFWQDIDNLKGLFCRYNIDTEQLKQFLDNKEKKRYFKNMSCHSNVWPIKNNVEEI